MTRVLVGHWLNNRWGWGRKVLKLYRHTEIPDGSDGAWALHVEVGRELEDDFPYRTERRVREDIDILLSDPDLGPFRLVGGTEHEPPAG